MARKRREFSREFKLEAVRLLLQRESAGGSLASVTNGSDTSKHPRELQPKVERHEQGRRLDNAEWRQPEEGTMLNAVMLVALMRLCIAENNAQATRVAADTTTISVRRAVGQAVERPAVVRIIGRIDGASSRDMFGTIATVATTSKMQLLVADSVTNQVTMFDSAGRFVRLIGRSGMGPGEYQKPLHVAVGPRGDIVIEDARSRRLTIYDSAGVFLQTLDIPRAARRNAAGGRVSPFMRVDKNDVLWVAVEVGGFAAVREGRVYFLRVGLNGRVIDTVEAPRSPHAVSEIRASGAAAAVVAPRRVPFSPSYSAAVSARGVFVTGWSAGRGGRYSVELMGAIAGAPAGYRWSERDNIVSLSVPYAPVRVVPGEARDWERMLTELYRWYSANVPWVWNATRIPASKAPYERVLVDEDDRIWLSVAAEARMDSSVSSVLERASDNQPLSTWPRRRWPTRSLFDIIDVETMVVRRVELPAGMSLAAARGNMVWCVINDGGMFLRIAQLRLSSGG